MIAATASIWTVRSEAPAPATTNSKVSPTEPETPDVSIVSAALVSQSPAQAYSTVVSASTRNVASPADSANRIRLTSSTSVRSTVWVTPMVAPAPASTPLGADSSYTQSPAPAVVSTLPWSRPASPEVSDHSAPSASSKPPLVRLSVCVVSPSAWSGSASSGHRSHRSPTPSPSPSAWSGSAVATHRSHRSPTPSPSPSAWSAFATAGQLSGPPPQTPSPSPSSSGSPGQMPLIVTVAVPTTDSPNRSVAVKVKLSALTLMPASGV